MLVRILKPDFQFTDERGTLTQLVRDGWKQINVITSAEGAERGGHFHKLNDEAFYVIEGEIRLILEKDGVKEAYDFKTGDMFEIGSEIMHSFMFQNNTVLVSLYNKGVELPDNKKDIYTRATEK